MSTRKRGGAQPIAVGRIPGWWMDCTPHYVLDVEEAERKRRFDATLAFYYSQLAAADDAGILGPDGKPILGPDGRPLEWKGSPWAGRGGGGEFGPVGPGAPGGRNFKIQKDVKIDPTLFGIQKSDPDYRAYLTGAKLPPAFLEKMQELLLAERMANNVAQTEYGKYGRQAEQPAFQPSWVKMKLKTTTNSEKVYSGLDSTETHYQRRLQGSADPIQEMQSAQPRTKLVRKTRKVRREKPKPPANPHLDSFIQHETPKHTMSISTLGQESLVRPPKNEANERTIRAGHRKDIPSSPQTPAKSNVPLAVQVARAAQLRSASNEQPKPTPSWRQNQSITHGASHTPAPKMALKPVTHQAPSYQSKPSYSDNSKQVPSAALKPVVHRAPEPNQSYQRNYSPYQPSDSQPVEPDPEPVKYYDENESDYMEETVVLPEDEEEYIEEEYIEYEDDEMTYEEMEITDSGEEDEDLNDLQAILAARQEELARLEAGY